MVHFYDFYYNYNSGSRQVICRRGGGSGNITTSLTVGTSAFRLLTYTYDGSTMRMYVDGSQVGTDTATGTVSASLTPQICIGQTWNGGTAQGLNAIFDDFIVWNRAITSTEVSDIWDSGTGLAYPFGAVPSSFIPQISIS